MPVQTISRDELKKKLDEKKNFILLNVLSPDSYAQGAIKGSTKIPLAQLDKRYGELDTQQEIVTYCAGPHCSASRLAAEKLEQKGFNVRAYEGGIEEWKNSGFPIEGQTVEALEQPSGLSGLPPELTGRTRH